ncbi:50S ribosomal protein L4 [Candidatus Woesearchaeota archaeon]|nr:50S ribosomal protein L4 [Candidatus Woesearchaeota archaeon]
MKLKIMTAANSTGGDITLPKQFDEPVRTDIITRAVLTIQANARQAYGGYGGAGMRHSAELSKRRRKYRGSYGKGQSRVPRKIHTRRGTQMYMVAALVPGVVGGRRAHGPKPFKDWTQKINTVENRKAIRSAMAATMDRELVEWRGHKLPPTFPFIIDNDFEQFKKTAELETALVKLGFADELARGSIKKIRAGRGTMRGRKHKTPVSFLFVTSKKDVPMVKAAANIPGAEVVPVEALNAETLAPGTHPGRLTLYTKSAMERLEKEGLFMKTYKGPKVEKPKKAPKKEVPVKKVEPKPVKKAEPKEAAK